MSENLCTKHFNFHTKHTCSQHQMHTCIQCIQREREKQTDRQIKRQSEWVRGRETHTNKDKRETHKHRDKETRQRWGVDRDPVPWQRDPLWFCPDNVLLFLPLRWFWPPLSWCTPRHCSPPGTSDSPAVKKQQRTPLWCITSGNQIPATHSDPATRSFFLLWCAVQCLQP